ncbi:MAG: DNA-directed RNA polymerase subunit beta [Mesotoga sp.]|mgnify:FL=1|jgi:DNA-directed RNA polymerase subunit beta|nr:DNA-directed RNA polymerase subunit beta [Mesotoga sp.]HON28036.1 DNA-directed RNA polymerase subunit beta [Mesotoga infera]
MRKANFGKRERWVFGRVYEPLEIPNLIEIQTRSFNRFIDEGLLSVLKKYSPIKSQIQRSDLKKGEKGFSLDFVATRIGEAKHSIQECKDKGLTYSVPLYVTVRITDLYTGEIKEEEAFFGYLPYMTDNASFIINGAERVIVNQLVRSPGVYFVDEPTKAASGSLPIYVAHFLPVKGAWFEILLNPNKQIMQARIDRRRKLNFFVFLKTLGYEDDVELLKLFENVIDATDEDELLANVGSIVLKEIRTPGGEVIAEKGKPLTEEMIAKIIESDVKTVSLPLPIAMKTYLALQKTYGQGMSEDDAFIELFRKLRPGEIPRINAAKSYINNLYFSPDRFDFSDVGRYKVNARLKKVYQDYLREVEGKKVSKDTDYAETSGMLTPLDVVLAARHLTEIESRPELLDTKDHLGNKRVRTVGELMETEFEKAFIKIHKLLEEKLTIYTSFDKITVQSLVNVRTLMTTLHQFFATSQLSQFMDQVNPLAELTNKRRLSAIGPGGLKREHARFEVRDVHHSHYGRMCPIETPEGANIGLMTSMATYATIDKYGFLLTPYRKVEKGKVTDDIVYLAADEEERYNIAHSTVKMDSNGKIADDSVEIRYAGEVRYVKKEDVDYMSVSPKQIVSISTSLIPFLEHDDANRALMGSNMQRQAVPVVKSEAPIVGTGVEGVAARDSGYVVLAKHSGRVSKVDGRKISIHRLDEKGEPVLDINGKPVEDEYLLQKFVRTNQDTAVNQRPIVSVGEIVKEGDPIADGPSTDMGELALGKNVLVAFMPWEGYNFEDAILVNQELLGEDTFTTIHVEMYETIARDTQLGPEEITADIPNVSKESLKNLDENGIVRVGAYVTSQDILVGKVTPKGESETTPEEKIIRSVFGDRGRDVKDSSLKLPHGVEGRVIDVKVFDKEEVSELGSGINKLVKVFVGIRKPLDVGDKLAGRHGNKGVVSNIIPKEDMPFLPDGTPIQLVLSPLGVPSRMNVGQVLETHLGWLGKLTNRYFATPIFDGATEEEIMTELYHVRRELGLDEGDSEGQKSGKVTLRDGRTGEPFDYPVVVGIMYMLKLVHIAKDKIHARSTGPYSLIHQQPLGGKAHFGGQRFGEMEVWALEAHGAAHTLNEMLTIKSDDIKGRNDVYKAILKGINIPEPGIPESFKVLIKELQGLSLDVKVFDQNSIELDVDKL